MFRCLAPSLCLVLLVAAAPAGAEERPLVRPAGPALEDGAPARPRMLTGALLKECVRLDEAVRELDQQLAIKGPHLTAAEKYYQRLQRDVDAQHAALDDTDAGQVASYNRAVIAEGKAVEEYNAMLPEYNALVARQNEGVAQFNAQCAARPYYRKQWLEASVALFHEREGKR
jgi:hypothetical protein